LPNSFGFDKLGVLIRTVYAIALGANNADIPEPSGTAVAEKQLNSVNTIDKDNNDTTNFIEPTADTINFPIPVINLSQYRETNIREPPKPV